MRAISSMAEANAYLPEFLRAYNDRFAVAPRAGEDAHRRLAGGDDLDRILTLCERRTLSKNLTLSYDNVLYQIVTKRAAYTMRGAHVEVRETSAGQITIEYKGQRLDYSIHREQERQQAQVIPTKMLDGALARPSPQAKRKPGPVAPSHPWRNFDYSEKSIAAMEKRGDICTWRK